MKNINSIKAAIFTACLFISTLPVIAQLPDNVDAGESDDSVSIYQQPKYIIPIVVFFLIIIGFYFWQKRTRK